MHVDYNKVYACYGVQFSKNTPMKNFKQGGAFAQGFSIVPWFGNGIILNTYCQSCCIELKQNV